MASDHHIFTALLDQGQILFFRLDPHGWHIEEIEGETATFVHNTADLKQVFKKLEHRLNLSDRLGSIELHLLYGDSHAGWPADAAAVLGKLGCTRYQILRFKPLHDRAAAIKAHSGSALADIKWLENTLMPLLGSTLSYADEAWEAEQSRIRADHEETIGSLRAERDTLEARLAQLRGEMKSMQSHNVDRLAVFLPMLYRNFWSHVKPSDLALLAGSYAVPDIPSPFPEPDEHTLATLLRRFQDLPEQERARLIEFCRSLNLDPRLLRSGMQRFFN